jgi:hypothetical protein
MYNNMSIRFQMPIVKMVYSDTLNEKLLESRDDKNIYGFMTFKIILQQLF